jgi:hypothetical protein
VTWSLKCPALSTILRGIARGGASAALVPKLPTTLAIPIDEYCREADDYRALHRICSALEITARFLAVVVLAELWKGRATAGAEFPEKLLKQLLQHLERPTLASWRVLIQAAVEALPGSKEHRQCLLPDLPDYVDKFASALGPNSGDRLKNLLPMRNHLAHNGRISDEEVTDLLSAHTQRFEYLMSELKFLSNEFGVALVASPSKGPARSLRGLSLPGEELDRSQLPEDFRQAGPDRMLLVTQNETLDLCPLHAYGAVFHIVKYQLQRAFGRADLQMPVSGSGLGLHAAHLGPNDRRNQRDAPGPYR